MVFFTDSETYITVSVLGGKLFLVAEHSHSVTHLVVLQAWETCLLQSCNQHNRLQNVSEQQ